MIAVVTTTDGDNSFGDRDDSNNFSKKRSLLPRTETLLPSNT